MQNRGACKPTGCQNISPDGTEQQETFAEMNSAVILCGYWAGRGRGHA